MTRRIQSAPRCNPARCSSAASGHTLFELVMVLAIIVTIAAIAAPRMSSAEQRYRADAAAQRIVADLEYVSRTARAASTTYAVSFSLTSHSYSSSAKPLDHAPDQPYTVILSRPPYRAQLQSVDFNGSTSVSFNGYGLPVESGTIDLAAGAVQRTVHVDALTGAITVQ